MKPDQQFINVISALYPHRQKAITNDDLIKHANQVTSFYSISQAKFVNQRIVSETQPFSDQIIIEIERNASQMTIGNDREQRVYKRLSNIELSYPNGVAVLHWRVADADHSMFTVVKLISPDSNVQIKLITFDNVTQFIHNVCELPNI